MLNGKIIKQLVKIDYYSVQNTIGNFLIDEVLHRKSNGVIFGLSGGIDSSLVAVLCAKFVKNKSLALIMPNSKITPKGETEDAIRVVNNLSIKYKIIDIECIHQEYSRYLDPDPLAFGNLGARIRANLLYYYANLKNYLVLGSSDRSEFLIGYFTKFGDGAADLLPIVSLYKTQVRGLAKNYSLLSDIAFKPSSPHLWKGHEAEKELGLTYDEIDAILHCIVDIGLSVKETSKISKISVYDVQKVYTMYKRTEHKRIVAKPCFVLGQDKI